MQCSNGHDVSAKDSFCSVCGSSITSSIPNGSFEPTKETLKSKFSRTIGRFDSIRARFNKLQKPTKILIGVLIPILMILLVLQLLQPRDGWLANNSCNDATISQLKSPATGKIVSSSAHGPVSWNGSEMLGTPNAELEKLLYSVSDLGEFTKAIDQVGFLLKPVRESDAKGFYIVIGVVDGSNGFGATVRNNWLCVVQIEGATVANDPSVIFITS